MQSNIYVIRSALSYFPYLIDNVITGIRSSFSSTWNWN